MPSGSVGTLTIDGNYTQNAATTLQIDVTPTQASSLRVNGNASLAGGLSLIYAPGTYTSTTYTLVQAHELTGTFANVASSGATPTALNPTIAYTSTQANLVLTAAAPPPPAPPPPAPPPAPPPIVVAPADGGLYADLLRVTGQAGLRTLATVLDATLRPRDVACDDASATQARAVASSCHSDLWLQYGGSSDSLPALTEALSEWIRGSRRAK